jgi:hypothetical protein
MATTYKKNSPWYKTIQNNLYLETMVYREIPKTSDDAQYIIETQYKHRPDLLAYDMYGDPKLWWVFVNRNREILKDPIYDFLPGVTIYCPRKQDLLNSLSD